MFRLKMRACQLKTRVVARCLTTSCCVACVLEHRILLYDGRRHGRSFMPSDLLPVPPADCYFRQLYCRLLFPPAILPRLALPIETNLASRTVAHDRRRRTRAVSSKSGPVQLCTPVAPPRMLRGLESSRDLCTKHCCPVLATSDRQSRPRLCYRLQVAEH